MTSARDPFYGQSPGVLGPPTHAAAVTPDDNVDLAVPARRLYIGAAGNVKVLLRDDLSTGPVVLVGLAVGVWHEVWVRRVLSTGTTATNIVAGW